MVEASQRAMCADDAKRLKDKLQREAKARRVESADRTNAALGRQHGETVLTQISEPSGAPAPRTVDRLGEAFDVSPAGEESEFADEWLDLASVAGRHGVLTVSMAAQILHEDPQKVRRLIRSGKLAFRRDGEGANYEIPVTEIARILAIRRGDLLDAKATLEAAIAPDRSK